MRGCASHYGQRGILIIVFVRALIYSHVDLSNRNQGSKKERELEYNVCSAEKYTKRSSNTLLHLVYFYAEQTLFAVYRDTDRKNVTDFLYQVLHLARKVTC